MKHLKKIAGRLLYRTAATMTGYIGREISSVVVIVISTVPACWFFAAAFVALSK